MIETFLEIRGYLQYAALIAVTVAAFWKGAGPEKTLAVSFWALIACHRFYHFIAGSYVEFVTVDIAHAVLDTGFGIGAIAIALYANRMYPLWFAGLQIIAIQSHIARAMAPDVAPLAYAIMQIAPSYFQILVLGVGVWLHTRRQSKWGRYRSWRIPEWWPSQASKLA